MSEENNPSNSILERLAIAADGIEVTELLNTTMPFAELAKHAKEPPIRRAIMLLANDDGKLSEYQRSQRAGLLAKIWSIKATRGMVDEYSPQFLKVALGDLSDRIPRDLRLPVSAWLAGKRYEWISGFAARNMVIHAKDADLGRLYLELLLKRSASLAAVFNQLSMHLADSSIAHPEASSRSIFSIFPLLSKAIGKSKLAAGRNMAGELYRFLESAFRSVDSSGSRESELAVEMILSLMRAHPGLLMSPVARQILANIGSVWPSPSDKKWLNAKQELVSEISRVVAMLCLGGICPNSLADLARELALKPADAEKLFRHLSEAYDFPDDGVSEWLSNGGRELGNVGSRSDSEALAAVLRRANELLGESESCDSTNLRLVQALNVELSQYAARKGLALEYSRGETVPFDPLRHRASVPVTPGSLVRVLVPAATRRASANAQLILPAIVEPTQE